MIIFHNPPPVWAEPNMSQRFLTAIMRNIAHLPLIGFLTVFLNKDIHLERFSSGILYISSANPSLSYLATQFLSFGKLYFF